MAVFVFCSTVLCSGKQVSPEIRCLNQKLQDWIQIIFLSPDCNSEVVDVTSPLTTWSFQVNQVLSFLSLSPGCSCPAQVQLLSLVSPWSLLQWSYVLERDHGSEETKGKKHYSHWQTKPVLWSVGLDGGIKRNWILLIWFQFLLKGFWQPCCRQRCDTLSE